jgi:predicted metalloprotease
MKTLLRLQTCGSRRRRAIIEPSKSLNKALSRLKTCGTRREEVPLY